MNKANLVLALQSVALVTFLKSNGDTREMKAVVNPDGVDQYSTDAVSVIDTVTGAYRAIKASSVLSVNGEMV